MTAEDRAAVSEIEDCAVEAIWRWQSWAGLTDAQATQAVALATDAGVDPVDVDDGWLRVVGESSAESDEAGMLDYLREWVRVAAFVRRSARSRWGALDEALRCVGGLAAMQRVTNAAMAEIAAFGSDA